MAERVTSKAIISGNVVEIYEYEHGYLKGYKAEGNNGRIQGYKSENYEDNRKATIQRAKREIRRLINANIGQHGNNTAKFLSMTYAGNETDRDKANKDFKNFIQRLNYHIYDKKCSEVKYVSVIEYQERGAIHYHTVFFNIPYIPLKTIQNKIWKHGICWINKIDEVDNVGAYITEYMGKDEQGKEVQDERSQGKKLYLASRNLIKSTEITQKKLVDAVAAALPIQSKKFETEFENEYTGKIKYSQYVQVP